jgi:hypothetical protein
MGVTQEAASNPALTWSAAANCSFTSRNPSAPVGAPFQSPPRDQGCSTLWNAEEVEEAIEAADGGAEAVLEE